MVDHSVQSLLLQRFLNMPLRHLGLSDRESRLACSGGNDDVVLCLCHNSLLKEEERECDKMLIVGEDLCSLLLSLSHRSK